MAARESGSGAGGTGFLFGNIDRKGRLDEDYMDDDAKDTIDNVGSKVVEKDRDLREITEALPQQKKGEASDDDEDYDDDGAPSAGAATQSGVDYFDEQDDGMLDEQEREDMAALALRNAQKGKADEGEDDENYDDDDEDVAVVAKSPAGNGLALAEQRRLMEQARVAVRTVESEEPEPTADAKEKELGDGDDDTVAFSRIFMKPVPKLRYVPKRRRFGFVVPNAPPAPSPEHDDADSLEREHGPTTVDPVGLIVALDAENAAARNPAGSNERTPIVQTKKELLAEVDMSEYNNAAVPLVEGTADADGDEVEEIAKPAKFEMVEQLPWEEEIQWKDTDDKDDDDPWCVSDNDVDMVNGINNSKNEETQVNETADTDDDEDEFEEPVVMNVSNPDPPINPPKDTNSDSDDDMEWEDGQESVPKASEATTALNQVTEPNAQLLTSNLNTQRQNGHGQSQPTPPVANNNADNGLTTGKQKAPVKFQLRSVPQVAAKVVPKIMLPKTVLAPNKDLEEGLWVEDVMWDSQSEGDQEACLDISGQERVPPQQKRFSRLILDMNDANMTFEHLSDVSDEKNTPPSKVADVNVIQITTANMNDLIHSSGTHVHQLLACDRFNISNDIYYSSGAANLMKVDRRSILRGLQNAPPALKCLTTKNVLSDAELLSFRRPVLMPDNLPQNMKIQPFRRKRPKGGNAQIAGQIPKKKTELLCSEKDAYRVSLYEYALERQPCMLPIPGMASRIVTYARKSSAAEAAQAMKDAAGTSEADTVFMSPDEPPPLHAGELEADGQPLSVVESHVYAAPCVRSAAPTTDFLMVRKGNNMYVREIDSVISLGVTEPKVEVMSPNTERYKKYSRDRALLMVLREFSKMRKEIQKQQKSDKKGNRDLLMDPPTLDKATILEFMRKKTNNTEGVFMKMLKEIFVYKNGKFSLVEEPSKSLSTREAEILRTVVTPVETAACEAMEAGLQNLLDRGITVFTHPSNQGNITLSAEKSGLEAGPAVGSYIKRQLLWSPWFRSHHILQGQRQQKKELVQALSLSKIVNEFKEGAAVMESRLMSLTAAEMNNLLMNHYRVHAKKIPTEVEERRAMVREMALKKGKSSANDGSDYSSLIRNIIKKHRNSGVGKSAANGIRNPSSVSGIFVSLPLEVQCAALEDGNVSDLPEEEDNLGEVEMAAVLSTDGEDAFGKLPSPKPNPKGPIAKKNYKKPKVPKKPPLPEPITEKGTENAQEREELNKFLKSSAVTARAPENADDANDTEKKKTKRTTRIKVKKTRKDKNGVPQTYTEIVTDPAQVAALLAKDKARKAAKQQLSGGAAADDPKISSGGLKMAIPMENLRVGSKGGKKKTANKKVASNPNATASAPSKNISKTAGEREGQIGKVKINTKQLRQEKEQAALKRKRSQYGDDIEYRAKKIAKTSRRKRNGKVQLNNILERIEKTVRETEGYLVSTEPLCVARLREGESPPPNVVAKNLAIPPGTGLDFTAPVDTKSVPTYKDFVKKPMYFNLIRQNCKRMLYQSASEFRSDIELIVKNARAFNRAPGSEWVVQHAQLLLEVAVEQLSRKADEITAAEEMIKLEKSEAKAGPLNSKNKSKKSGDKKGKNGKKNTKKKKSTGNDEVVLIPDGSDREVEVVKASSVAVIDLNEPSGVEPIERQQSPAASPLPPPEASPPPAASPFFGAGMTDDIYSMDGPVLPIDGMGLQSDNLVLDLDDTGVTDGV